MVIHISQLMTISLLTVLLLDLVLLQPVTQRSYRSLELTRINAAPYYIKVKRRPFGAFGGVLENHADTTPVYKVNVQFDATWTEQSLDNTGPNDNVYLAEFGGALTNNDYVIIDRDDSPKVPEYIKVVAALEANEQKFVISSDCSAGSAGDVFVVNSVTGDIPS